MQRFTWLTRFIQLFFILCLSGSLFLPANADTFELKPFTSKYKVKKAGISLGEARFSLQKKGQNRWKYASLIQPKGIASLFSKDRVEEASIVEQTSNGVRPLSYYYRRSGSEAEYINVSFDWAQRIATINVDGSTNILPLKGNEQDHYSLALNLMRMAALGTQTNTLSVVTKKKNKPIKPYTYTRGVEEKVNTHSGKFNTVKLIQSPSGRRQMHYWIAPSLNYAPVKIEQYRKGKKHLTLSLKSFTFTQ